MAVPLSGDGMREEQGGSRETGQLTRRHPGRPLSARHRAGLLAASRPCPPRDHPPSGSIGPCLVIRPKADLALVGRDCHPAQLVPAHTPSGERVKVKAPSFYTSSGNARVETLKALAYFGDADGLASDFSTLSSLVTSRTPLVLRATRSASNLSSGVGTLP